MTNDVTQLAVIGGDGIGPEVTEQALHVLEQTVGSDAFATHEYHLGACLLYTSPSPRDRG